MYGEPEDVIAFSWLAALVASFGLIDPPVIEAIGPTLLALAVGAVPVVLAAAVAAVPRVGVIGAGV
jgi:hypothetical protein